MAEGVLIHGLYLEGCAWKKGEKQFEEKSDKSQFDAFPIIHVTAVSTNPATEKKPAAKQDTNAGKYSCPVYKYPKRNDRYLIFRPFIKADGQTAKQLSQNVTAVMNWKLKGVTLLCCKE